MLRGAVSILVVSIWNNVTFDGESEELLSLKLLIVTQNFFFDSFNLPLCN